MGKIKKINPTIVLTPVNPNKKKKKTIAAITSPIASLLLLASAFKFIHLY